MIVKTVLGDSKESTRTYGDGSVDCPWCSYPIVHPATTCANGWCEANPSWSPEALQAFRAKREAERKQKESDEARRRSISESTKQRHQEHEAWGRAQVEECRKRGACLACLFQPGWERVKFVKHRGPCPKSN